MTDNFQKCPHCGSENVIFSKKMKSFVCEDCERELGQEKPVIPMRIFLSYGHDSNEELVRRIYADLEKRGTTSGSTRPRSSSATNGGVPSPTAFCRATACCPSSRNIPPATPASASMRSPSPSA